MKLSPKSNQGFICVWIWVKPLCKSIITTKEALLRFTVVSFSGKLIFNGVRGHFYASIKITIFKTLRSLDTTWNFACSITRVSTHEHEHWEHCMCTQSLLKRRTTHVSNSTSGMPPSWQTNSVIPECNLTGRSVMVDLLRIRSHSGVDTFCLPRWVVKKPSF